jgi:predicted nucleic acid-binding Zn ribbon protein
MKKKKETVIGNLIHEFLRQQGLETPLNEHRLFNSWPEAVGPAVARMTGRLFIKNEVLVVEVKSPVMRSELMLKRSDLVKKLNDMVGAHVIRDISLI